MEYTFDLINLLHVLGRLVALEPAQAALLEKIVGGPLVDLDRVTAPSDDPGMDGTATESQ